VRSRNGKRDEIRIAPVAKGKKRRAEISEDADLLQRQEEAIAKHVRPGEKKSRSRDEIDALQVVNVMADEIQAVYEELGGSLNEINAQDKALTIWREVLTQTNVTAHEQEIPFSACKEHS
jgi:hypothetical protein